MPDRSGAIDLRGPMSLTWREVQPLLLRSAGVVGLVAIAWTFLSSELMLSQPDPRDSAAAVPQQSEIRSSGTLEASAAGTLFMPEPSVTGSLRMVRASASAQPIPSVRSEGTAPAPVVASAEPPPAPSAPVMAEPLSPPAAIGAQLDPARQDPEASDPAAAPEFAMLTGQIFTDGVLEPDAELGEALSLPQLPKAKPATIRKARVSARSRPAGPPPNCGSKHARWRYVKKTPTWYCR